MSALDDAYEAAAARICLPSEWHTNDAAREAARAYARDAVDAFLVHLANNPPEEVVKAVARPADAYGRVDPRFARQQLVAALRASIGEKQEVR
jgi:hypothetical protein